MLCVWLSSVEWAYYHEPQCHRRPVRTADVLDVGHVMTKLTMFAKSPKIHFKPDRHEIFCPVLSWPSSVRLRRERIKSASGLPVLRDHVRPVFEKSENPIFNFVTLLTGSGNENQKSGSVTTPQCVSSFQKWNPHVDITSGAPRRAPPNWPKHVFPIDLWKFAKNPFPVRSTWSLNPLIGHAKGYNRAKFERASSTNSVKNNFLKFWASMSFSRKRQI